ncbi:MAG: efflux RND transporter permease subunit [Myxococcota bacterium]
MLDWLARTVTTRRALVLALLALATGGLSSQIPKIQVDPSVENLISSYEDDGEAEAVARRFEEDFGDTDRVMVLLVQADDVLTQAPLQYLDTVTQHLEERPWIEQVVSLTRTPMPRRIEAAPAPTNFEDLERELEEEGEEEEQGGGFDSLEDELFGEDEEGYTGEDDFEPAVVDALVSLVEADPERFPGGFQALGPKLAEELKATAIVEDGEVTAESVTELRTAIAQSAIVEGRLISEDHQVAVSALFLGEMDPREMRHRVSELRQYLTDNPPPDGVHVHLGGLPYLRSSIVENIRSDQIVLVPLTLVVCLLLLALALRWFPGVILPIAAVGITALMVVGGMALWGEPMNILNNIIPTLLIIIGISDSIHLIGRYREELLRTSEKNVAGRRTVHAMAVACLLTSVTTSVGLASLVVSRTVMLRHFGVTAALGVMAAYLVTITFLPAVLTWVKAPSREDVRKAGGWLEVGIMRMTAWVLKRPWQILAVTGLLLAGATYGATQLNVDHALLDQFDSDDPVYQTTRLLEAKLDGVRPLEVSLTADEGTFYQPGVLNHIDEIAAWAKGRDEVLATMSQNDILKQSLALLSGDEDAVRAEFQSDAQVRALGDLLQARQEDADPLGAWIDDDRSHMRLQIKVRDVGAQATMRFIRDLEGELGDRFEGDSIRYSFTGEAYDGSVGMDAVVGDLLWSLLTAVLIIFVLLAGLFRSLRLGILSIPPNVIPLVFTMAYMVMRGIPLNAATVIIFSISLGLAVDGTIHVLARFREETRERGFRAHPALIRAARGTGRAIVVSCVTLMAGFAVLLMSNFVPVRRFGELIAVTVAGCLFATLIVQPALLHIAGIRRERPANAGPQPTPETAE